MRTQQQENMNQQACEDFHSGNFDAALEIWLQLARTGDAEAKNNISAVFDSESYWDFDKKKSYEWALDALKAGHLPALATVGKKLINGAGVLKDVDKGIELLEAAASEGDTSAMIALASVYMRGEDRPKDLEKFVSWLLKAAESGDPLGQLMLAAAYDNGMGVEVSVELSTHWYVRAYENGNAEATFPVGTRLLSGHGLSQDIPKGIAILKEGAERGIVQAMRSLGMVYTTDLYQHEDFVEGLSWYEKAAECGDIPSESKLGFLYTYDNRMSKNVDRGLYWLERAVVHGDAHAKAILGTLLMNGEHCSEDVSRALRLFEEAVAAEDEAAMLYLGKCFLQGINVEKDEQRGLALIERAAEKEWPAAVEYWAWVELKGVEGFRLATPELAVSKLEQRALAGDGSAAYVLSKYLESIPGQDLDAVLHWLRMAANAEHTEALVDLGLRLIRDPSTESKVEAIKLLKLATPSKDGLPEFNLAYHYFNLSPKDYKAALHWAELASSKGIVWGQHYIALILASEEFEGQDYERAFRVASKLAEAGLMNSCALLGNLFDEGKGTPVDKVAAAHWYQKAAEQGDLVSSAVLGRLLFHGDEGFPAKPAESVRWLTGPADRGDLYCMTLLSYIHADGELVPEDMVEAYKYLALAWPYAEGALHDALKTLKPDFEQQMNAAELEESRSRADCLRSSPDFLVR